MQSRNGSNLGTICSLTSLASPGGHKGRSEGNSAEEALETPHDAITLPMNNAECLTEVPVSSCSAAQCGDLVPGAAPAVPRVATKVVDSPVDAIGEVLSRVAAVESKFNDFQIQAAPQVVQAVVNRLPQLITPIVEQGLATSLGKIKETIDKTMGSKYQIMIESAVKQLKAELDLASIPCSLAPAVLLEPSAPCAKASPDSAPENFAAIGQKDIDKGDTVIIDGLLKASELNGKVGVVVDFDSSSGRYKVELEGSQDTKRIKRCNLLGVSDLADDYDYNADD